MNVELTKDEIETILNWWEFASEQRTIEEHWKVWAKLAKRLEGCT